MTNAMKKLFLGASIAVGISTLGAVPAFAGSLTGASVTGTNGTDFLKYEAVDVDVAPGNDKTQRNDAADLGAILQGSCTVVAGACSPTGSPGGNVELAADSEQTGFDFSTPVVLNGTIGGKSIAISSLTASDWSSEVAPGVTLLDKWLADAFGANGISPALAGFAPIKNAFIANNGRQRFSDPNISYVNQDDVSGEISIGLAGHYNASAILKATFGSTTMPNPLNPMGPQIPVASLVPGFVQASEIVKVSYDGGPFQYLYSFQAALSGLTEKSDGVSHNGNYEVSLAGTPPTESTPEPATVLGLLAVGGAVAASRRQRPSKA